MKVLVKLQNGEIYSVSEDGIISREKGENFNVLIVPKLTSELVRWAIETHVKLMECDGPKEECLIRVTRLLFPQCEYCKFE